MNKLFVPLCSSRFITLWLLGSVVLVCRSPALPLALPDPVEVMPVTIPGTESIPVLVTTATPPLPQEGIHPRPVPDLSGPKKPRRLPVKPAHTVVGPEMRADVVTVKFKNGLKLRAENGLLVNLQSAAAVAAASAQASRTGLAPGAMIPPAAVAQELGMLPAGYWKTVGRDVPTAEDLDALRARGEANINEELPDLNLYIDLLLPAPSDVAAVIDQLNALGIVELASPKPAVWLLNSVQDSTHYQLVFWSHGQYGVDGKMGRTQAKQRPGCARRGDQILRRGIRIQSRPS